MSDRGAWSRIGWPLAGVVWLWLELLTRGDAVVLVDFGVAGGSALLALATAVVARTLHLLGPPLDVRSTRRRRLEALLLVVVVVASLVPADLRGVAVAALAAIVWVGMFRVAPRLGLVLIMMVWTLTSSLAYFGVVLIAVGLLLVPGSLAGYVRELMPGRLGSVP